MFKEVERVLIGLTPDPLRILKSKPCGLSDFGLKHIEEEK
jgi:hypothetical protein